jgi:uncharacterized membrane protein YdjX (TVP38/TMEM64 family)
MAIYGGEAMTEKHKKIVAIVAMLIFVLFCGAVGYFVGVPMVQLAEDPAQFQALVDSYGIGSRLIFIGMVVLQVVVAFIPGEPIELAAGYAFGFIEGTLLTLAGFLIGSLLVFLLVKKFGVKLVEVFFSADKINFFSFLKNPKKTKAIAFILMLIPGTPKDLLTYFVGLTDMKLGTFLLISLVGRLPSVLSSTVGGHLLGDENYMGAIWLYAITGAVSLAGLLTYNAIIKRKQEK